MELQPEHINQFLSQASSKNQAGVVYSIPHSTQFQVLIQDLGIENEWKESSFVFYPFDGERNPVVTIHPTWMNEEALNRLEPAIPGNYGWSGKIGAQDVETSQDQYQTAFNKCMEAIELKRIQKVVLSTLSIQELPENFNPGEFVFQLRKMFPMSFVYVFTSPFTGTWIGASPEALFYTSSDELMTMSLAGTKHVSDNEYSFGEKERIEQEIVTDYIQQFLEKEIGNATISPVEEVDFGSLKHLKTSVSSKLSQPIGHEHLLRLARKFHPTPAIAGFPQSESIQLIKSIESHPRHYYSGFLGTIDMESAQLMVNLRCMRIAGNRAYIYAGGGITAESQMHEEWLETRYKAETLKQFLR